MNQFKTAWEFAFANWKYFLMLVLPVAAVESLAAYMFLPLNNVTQPEDIANFLRLLSLPIETQKIFDILAVFT